MDSYKAVEEQLDQTTALIQIAKDMLDQKRKETKMLFIALIVSLVINVIIVGTFLWYESGWDYSDTVTTETNQVVDGEGNSLVNGDQYNDKSTNNSGGEK